MTSYTDSSLDTPSGLPRTAPFSACAPGFRRLYEAHFDLVFGLICRFGVAPHDAEDLTQQVFFVAHRRLHEVGNVVTPQAWLRAIAVRVVHAHYRWKKVRRVHAWLVERTWAARSTDEQTPERATLADEALEKVQMVLQQMSSKLRDTLVLVELEELDPRDAAETLGIPLNTLRSRRALARAEFRRLWKAIDANKDADHG